MIYIDTIQVGYQLCLDMDWVRNWPYSSRNWDRETYIMPMHYPCGEAITVTYHPTDMQGNPAPLTLFEFSTPKMLHPCNHDMSSDIYQAIEKANSLIAQNRDFSSVKIEDGLLHRIDTCYQHDVGDLVLDYIQVLKQSDYFRRETQPYRPGGVQFPSAEETSKFYPKYLECHHQEAVNDLRQETTIRGSDHIGELCGKRHPTILDIDPSLFSKKVLEKDLKRLRLDKTTICTREIAVETLIQKYGASRASNLIGYMRLRENYTRDQLISQHLLTPQAISYRERLIELAGVAIHINEKVSLPPLTIDI